MRFIVNEDKKIIFGWSPKCGCTHVKNMVYFLENKYLDKTHISEYDTYELPYDISSYIIIIIIRNPYKRIISGLFDKYKSDGVFRDKWTVSDQLCFSNFLNKLFEEKYDLVDYEHFSPQTSGWFEESIESHTKTIIYDLENIDYEYLGSLYNKTIPIDVRLYRGTHFNKNIQPFNEPAYDIEIDKVAGYKIAIDFFYNQELINKMLHIFKKDFEFFESKGFYYSCKETDDLARDHSKSISKIINYNASKFNNRNRNKRI